MIFWSGDALGVYHVLRGQQTKTTSVSTWAFDLSGTGLSPGFSDFFERLLRLMASKRN